MQHLYAVAAGKASSFQLPCWQLFPQLVAEIEQPIWQIPGPDQLGKQAGDSTQLRDPLPTTLVAFTGCISGKQAQNNSRCGSGKQHWLLGTIREEETTREEDKTSIAGNTATGGNTLTADKASTASKQLTAGSMP